MPNPAWPTAFLPPQPLRAAWELERPRLSVRSDMDDGRARARRRYRSLPVKLALAWPFTPAQYEIFKGFSADMDLSVWFDMPVFEGEAYGTRACRFAEIGKARLEGNMIVQPVTVEVDGFQFLGKAALAARFPGLTW